jgi:hypothetical protein
LWQTLAGGALFEIGFITMAESTVSIFHPYPFKVGQKITIAGGPRNGDWLVVDVKERKVILRCPISGREFEWDRFCYFVEEHENVVWPHKD